MKIFAKILWIISALIITISYFTRLNDTKAWLMVIVLSFLLVFVIGKIFKKAYTWKIPAGSIVPVFLWHGFVAASSDQSAIYTMVYEIPFIIITILFTIGFHIFSNSNLENIDK